MTLHKKMAKGVFWSVLEKGGQQFASFFLFMLIARMVGPEEYGLAMLCFVFLAFCSLLFNGMGDGIVTLQIKDSAKLSSLFWVIIGTGFIVSLLCFGCARPFANFFNEPDLETLLKWFSIVPTLLAVQTVPQLLFMQRMDFKIYAIRSLVAIIGSGLVGVYMAYNGYGAFALIAQQIALYTLANMILWHFVGWKPALMLKKADVIETIAPGLKMMLSNTLAFVEQQAPRLFLGSFLGPISVGYYAFAFRMRMALQDMLIIPAFAVLFPALSQIKGQSEEQNKIIGGIFFLIGLIVFPAVSMAILTAPLYVPLFFGDKWLPAIDLLQLFLVLGFVAPFAKVAEVIFRAHNKVGTYLKGQGVTIGVGTAVVYYYSQYDLMAVAWVIIGYSLIGAITYFALLSRYANIHLWHHFSRIIKSTISTIGMVLAVFYFMRDVQIANDWSKLLATLSVGGVSYVSLCFLMQKNDIISIVQRFRT